MQTEEVKKKEPYASASPKKSLPKWSIKMLVTTKPDGKLLLLTAVNKSVQLTNHGLAAMLYGFFCHTGINLTLAIHWKKDSKCLQMRFCWYQRYSFVMLSLESCMFTPNGSFGWIDGNVLCYISSCKAYWTIHAEIIRGEEKCTFDQKRFHWLPRYIFCVKVPTILPEFLQKF